MLRRWLYPLRAAFGRFAITPEWRQPPWMVSLSLIEKAAWFVAAEKVEGDYLEFGVYQGASFIAAYKAFSRIFPLRIRETDSQSPSDAAERQAIWDRMRFFAFDSFEGLPELEGIDRDVRSFGKGQFAADLDEFLTNLSANNIPVDRVVCIPGWFSQTCVPATLEKHGLKKAAVIWIDSDLYESAKIVLPFVRPLLQDGTVLIFDDWYNFKGHPGRGEQRAMAEWSKTLSDFAFAEYQKEGPWRVAFIASRTQSHYGEARDARQPV
jgi:O-methyltransferase